MNSQDYLLKIQHFCNFSLVSLSIHPRSRRGPQRIRKGERRWSRAPKTFTRWNRPPKTFSCFIRPSSADVKQNKQTPKPCRRQAKQTLESVPPQNSKHYNSNLLTFGSYTNFVNHPGAADVKIQPKYPEFLLDMRYFCNFLLVSLGIRPRSLRGAERTRQGEGRWSRPPKPSLERSYLTENSSSANRILKPRRKQTPDQIPGKKNDRIYIYFKDVSREFDEFRVNTHLFKLRCWYL